MRCPICSLECFPGSKRCDCGFSFESGEIKNSDVIFYIASPLKRFLNMIIDYILMYIISFITGFILRISGILGQPDKNNIYNYWGAGLLVILAYYLIFEGIRGQTIGKMITGTKVFSKDGSKSTFLKAIGRTLCRFIPFEPYSFLTSRIGWHDKISGTIVVDLKRLPQNLINETE